MYLLKSFNYRNGLKYLKLRRSTRRSTRCSAFSFTTLFIYIFFLYLFCYSLPQTTKMVAAITSQACLLLLFVKTITSTNDISSPSLSSGNASETDAGFTFTRSGQSFVEYRHQWSRDLSSQPSRDQITRWTDDDGAAWSDDDDAKWTSDDKERQSTDEEGLRLGFRMTFRTLRANALLIHHTYLKPLTTTGYQPQFWARLRKGCLHATYSVGNSMDTAVLGQGKTVSCSS